MVPNRRLGCDPHLERGTDQALDDDRLPDFKLAASMQNGGSATDSGPGRRSVDLAIGENANVATVNSAVRRLMKNRAVEEVEVRIPVGMARNASQLNL